MTDTTNPTTATPSTRWILDLEPGITNAEMAYMALGQLIEIVPERNPHPGRLLPPLAQSGHWYPVD